MTIKKRMGPAHAQATRAARPGRRYPSDLTDTQWQVISPLLPEYVPGQRGRPPLWSARAIVDAILYVNRTGCAWRFLPADFPPWRTVYEYFARWRDDGTLQRVHDQLRTLARQAAGRSPHPSAAVIDSQSIRAAGTVSKSTRGARNRHMPIPARRRSAWG